MSHRLEQFVSDHREEFDSEEPGKKLWDKIRQEMDPPKENKAIIVRLTRTSLSVAAAVLLVVAAGIWYLAGANTCVYSNPKDELGATQHVIQTSNRRFRDDEFIIPRDLTRGRSAIRVRVKFTPVKIPLFPGQSLPELAWSEIRYDAYCYVMPALEIPSNR